MKYICFHRHSCVCDMCFFGGDVVLMEMNVDDLVAK